MNNQYLLERIYNELNIFEYFSKKNNFNEIKQKILDIIFSYDYCELHNKTLIINFNSLDDFFFKSQLKSILNSKYKINIFLYLLKEDKYYFIKDFVDINEKNSEIIIKDLNQENINLNDCTELLSCDLLIKSKDLKAISDKKLLLNFHQKIDSFFEIPTSFLLDYLDLIKSKSQK